MQNGAVDTATVLRNIFEHIVQGTRHVQARGHTRHGQHLKSKGGAPHFTQMNVAIHNAGLQHLPRVVLNHSGAAAGKINTHFGDLTIFDGHVSDRFNMIERINNGCAFK